MARSARAPIEVGHPTWTLVPFVLGPRDVPRLDDAGAARRLDEETARLYYDLVVSRLGEAARAALEDLMNSGDYEYQSEFARKYVAQGRAEGKAEGKAEGEAKGKADAVLAVLAARHLVVSPTTRARIASCRDLAKLDRWLTLAVTAASADELVQAR